MASNTPDGASGEGPVHNYQALKKILRLAEEIYPLVEPGHKELEYMTEEQSKCTTLIKELQNGNETLKENLKDLELVSVSKEEHTQLKSKYQQLASEAKRRITKQKQRLIYLENLSTGAEQQIELLQQEVSEAMSREEQLNRLLEQKEEELVKAKRVTEEIRLNGINITNTSWNKRRGFDDLAEATNREAELNMQVTKLRKRLTDVENELNETKTRLSRTMGDKLTDNNPAITDLSDKNRPVKLAERYSELYDNEWTDSFEIIHKVYRDERNTVAQLLKILMDVAEFCRTESQKQFKTIRAAIAGENTGDTPLPKPVEKQLRDCRKVMAEKAGYTCTLFKMYMTKLRQSTSSVARDALIVPAYLKEAFTLCWLMCVQDPPVVFDEPPKHGDTLKSELYKSYTRDGTCVDFLVWPALLLHDGGPVLYRGVAQGFMYSLHEVPTSGQSLHRLPDRPERSQESTSGMINHQSTPADGKNADVNTASPFDIPVHGTGGSLKTKPTQSVTSACDTDKSSSGRVSGVPKDAHRSGSEAASGHGTKRSQRPTSHKRPEEPAGRSQTSTPPRKNENHNVDTLPKVRQNSARETDILDITSKDINDFLSLLNKLNYNYAAVQKVMNKSKFDACCKFIKTRYG
ncbi:hypothetical protein DPMN_120813 [Dreissena polymorpha]|uniref:Mitochondria-eating protein C-terminal domain-containing protein n=1 Tax=Dreissena polymorpha TaxID=45954 RepID=A0A9D4JT14_DREPO|nr:hypothetical protein DPMN_120813 [Dreissena polymorpha]